jgi:hypothetical protein
MSQCIPSTTIKQRKEKKRTRHVWGKREGNIV